MRETPSRQRSGPRLCRKPTASLMHLMQPKSRIPRRKPSGPEQPSAMWARSPCLTPLPCIFAKNCRPARTVGRPQGSRPIANDPYQYGRQIRWLRDLHTSRGLRRIVPLGVPGRDTGDGSKQAANARLRGRLCARPSQDAGIHATFLPGPKLFWHVWPD
jgi:hypothetical protein